MEVVGGVGGGLRYVEIALQHRPQRSAKGGGYPQVPHSRQLSTGRRPSYPQDLAGYPQPFRSYPELSTNDVDNPVNGPVNRPLA